ncbi:MAG: hypothetical protein HRU23_00040 [Gammaproteobacteria bacterium]|nr:hypothetical protein [Gammaproteobacteria bacterium]
MRRNQVDKIQAHWWSKTAIGALLGLLLAYGLVATFAWYGPGGIDAPIKVQFNMWLITPLWLTIFSLVYLFKTGRSALIYLGGANVLCYSIFTLLRSLG